MEGMGPSSFCRQSVAADAMDCHLVIVCFDAMYIKPAASDNNEP